MPQLVVSGPKDSGKTSWACVLHRIVPSERVASITSEKQLSASMINDSTKLVVIDDWIAVYETQSLPRTTAGVDKWIHEHAMDCLVWTANEITANIDHVPRQERWYENTDGEASVIDDNNIAR